MRHVRGGRRAWVVGMLALLLLTACGPMGGPAGNSEGRAGPGSETASGTSPSEAPSGSAPSDSVPGTGAGASARPATIQFPTEVEGELDVRTYDLLTLSGLSFSAYVPHGWNAAPLMQTFSSGAAGGGVLISGGDDKPIQAIQVMMLPAGTGEKEARAAFDDLLRGSGGRDLDSEENPNGAPWAIHSAVVNIRQASPPAWEFSSFYLVPHGDRYFILRLGSTGEAADGMAAITSVFLHSWRWTDDGAPLDPRDHAGMRRLQGVGWSFEYPDSWDAAGVRDSQSGYVQESASGQTVNFSFKTATAGEVEAYVNAEIQRKLGASECDQSMASELTKQERDGVTIYRYAIRSHCGDTADGVLHNAVFFDGRTIVELRDGGDVPDSLFEDIVASFGFGW